MSELGLTISTALAFLMTSLMDITTTGAVVVASWSIAENSMLNVKESSNCKNAKFFFPFFLLQEQERLSVVTTGASGCYMRARARDRSHSYVCVYTLAAREREKKKTDNLNVR